MDIIAPPIFNSGPSFSALTPFTRSTSLSICTTFDHVVSDTWLNLSGKNHNTNEYNRVPMFFVGPLIRMNNVIIHKIDFINRYTFTKIYIFTKYVKKDLV